MGKKIKLIKKNLLPLLLGVLVLAIFITVMIVLTDINPITLGGASGVSAGFIIWAIIYRLSVNHRENKSDKK